MFLHLYGYRFCSTPYICLWHRHMLVYFCDMKMLPLSHLQEVIACWSRLKLVCVAHWRDEVLPAAQRIHAAHALCATHKAKHFTRILLSWRAYAAARAFKNTLSAHARAHRSQCILMHGWHALKQHRDIAKHKKELIRRAESHSKEMVVNRVWELWEQLVDMERKEVSAAMHREQVVALRGLRAFSESLHRRYTKRLAATHYRLSFQKYVDS